jgi:preprotein translocase subunit YajC
VLFTFLQSNLLPTGFLQAGFLQSSPATNPLLQGLPIVLIFGIFYFLLFMPMQKQKKAQKKMLEELKNGDVVLTSGGIIGSITAIEGDTVILRVKPSDLKLQFARSAISSLVPTEISK